MNFYTIISTKKNIEIFAEYPLIFEKIIFKNGKYIFGRIDCHHSPPHTNNAILNFVVNTKSTNSKTTKQTHPQILLFPFPFPTPFAPLFFSFSILSPFSFHPCPLPPFPSRPLPFVSCDSYPLLLSISPSPILSFFPSSFLHCLLIE